MLKKNRSSQNLSSQRLTKATYHLSHLVDQISQSANATHHAAELRAVCGQTDSVLQGTTIFSSMVAMSSSLSSAELERYIFPKGRPGWSAP